MGLGYYRSSDDVDAPELFQNVQGSFVQLLKTVLVDGYSSGGTAKAGLGWLLYEANSEVHASITEAVFQNIEGSGTYLMADGSGLRDTNAEYKQLKTYMRAAESVESYDSGLGLTPPPTVSAFTGYFTSGHTLRYATPVAWKIFGNARSFWVCLKRWQNQPSATDWDDRWDVYFYGDYDKVHLINQWNFALFQEYTTSANNYPRMVQMRSNTYVSNYLLRGEFWQPGGASCYLWDGTVEASTQPYFTNSYGPDWELIKPASYYKWQITHNATVMGSVPGILSGQKERSALWLPDKTIVYADKTLHFLHTFSATADHGYFILIEGKGYDDAV